MNLLLRTQKTNQTVQFTKSPVVHKYTNTVVGILSNNILLIIYIHVHVLLLRHNKISIEYF